MQSDELIMGLLIWPLRLILLPIFYGVFTPLGWLLRLAGIDFMNRRLDRARSSYWIPREKTGA
jgi:hypothetical protein